MKLRSRLMSLALLPLLAACGAQTNAPDSAPAPAPAETQTPATPTTDTTTPPASPQPEAPAEATSAAPTPTPAPLPSGPAPVAGVDYDLIPNGQPYAPLNGKIEVVEVFNYICPACGSFQSLVMPWRKTLPADVRLTYVPVAFGPEWQPYAQAYYAAESKGLVERTHDTVFAKIHVERSLPGEGQKSDPAKVAAFYANYGADPKEFLALMNSFGVNAKVNRGKQFAMQAGVRGTPTLVINGKYRVKGRSFEEMLDIANRLIAQERAAQ